MNRYGILPEEEDRPTAYELKRLIVGRAQGREDRSAVVLTDIWALNQEMAEFFPTIAVGGPGAFRTSCGVEPESDYRSGAELATSSAGLARATNSGLARRVACLLGMAEPAKLELQGEVRRAPLRGNYRRCAVPLREGILVYVTDP